MRKLFAAAGVVLAFACASCGQAAFAAGSVQIADQNNNQTCITTNPCPVTTTPSSGTGGFTAVTVGVSSAQALAAATSRKLLALDNESTSATIACAFGSVAAINTAGSFTIPPGQTRTWSGPYVPADAVNCIASAASSPLTVEAN